MQIKINHNTDTNVTLTITGDTETLAKIKQSVVARLGNSVKVTGFRPGKAPTELIEKNLDQQLLQTEFIDTVLNHYYIEAVSKEKLRTVGQPEVNLKKFVPFTTLEFDVTVDVLGAVKLPDYTKIKVAKDTVKVDTAMVDEVIESLRRRLADKQPVDRAAKTGDEVTIDFRGTDANGEPVKGADGKDYPLMLGSKTFIPGFEEEVVGLKKGDEKTFTIPFPKDYGVAVLQGKKVTFAITAKEVSELVLPKVDDNFAAKAGPFATVKDLKTDIKKQLTIEKQNEANREFETKLLRQIANKTTVSIPASVIDDQVIRMEQDEKQNLAYRGQTWQEHLDGEGVTEEEHRARNRKDAEEQVKIGVMIGAIGDKENIDVTPEEVEVRLTLLRGQYNDPTMLAELDKPEASQDIAARIRSEKIVAKLVKYAS